MSDAFLTTSSDDLVTLDVFRNPDLHFAFMTLNAI